MLIVHLTASTFFGGPERQMLGLGESLRPAFECRYLSFPEDGKCSAFVEEARRRQFVVQALEQDFPRVRAAIAELESLLRSWKASALLCHGYKANLLGRWAARRAGIPAVAVSRGWTWESWRVRFYEWLDRRHLRFMNHVVCVSQGQAERVRRWCGVPPERISVIYNSARWESFSGVDRTVARACLQELFPSDRPPSYLVIGAGRLSPEKGFAVLIAAAEKLVQAGRRDFGVVIFGDGRLRAALQDQIRSCGLTGYVVLAGFRTDLDRLLPGADVVVLPSFTEGMPNVALEASAAGVPVVATAVGGTPEVVADGETGYLVAAGDATAIAQRVLELLQNTHLREQMGSLARQRMQECFSFAAQAQAYRRLLERLCGPFPPSQASKCVNRSRKAVLCGRAIG
ncbi:MAG: glycosyltransferase family 4 protein [Thermogemmata sp.]|jgi:glycosyltransferase involved in cell wall biosynthesis|uniref:Glycosyltransferase family 4 protein n=1 Tax=Thermogemmata fonticola TaxID=2755323 RepID=A0A7V9AAI0_9BACT|nr:glycosyltransferase family 4 protein [Thermogemmata fonticola]MBA2225063.1 glycosyltransferase family 4 protein [Thermogemmata fonticola]MCX8139522.1 glycosyltransferase family 4 protein [Gemmataceae bacterium]GIW84484.1 MAG: glycosyl transferase [Gemmataceae bacterium]